VFRERRLEHLGVTVRVCGYQPQGVPSTGDTPSPKNSTIAGFTPPRTLSGILWGPPGLLSKRPPRPSAAKAGRQDQLLARFKLFSARFYKSHGFPVVLKGLLFFSLQRKRTRQLLMDLG
jgi:hypothetical protein